MIRTVRAMTLRMCFNNTVLSWICFIAASAGRNVNRNGPARSNVSRANKNVLCFFQGEGVCYYTLPENSTRVLAFRFCQWERYRNGLFTDIGTTS